MKQRDKNRYFKIVVKLSKFFEYKRHLPCSQRAQSHAFNSIVSWKVASFSFKTATASSTRRTVPHHEQKEDQSKQLSQTFQLFFSFTSQVLVPEQLFRSNSTNRVFCFQKFARRRDLCYTTHPRSYAREFTVVIVGKDSKLLVRCSIPSLDIISSDVVSEIDRPCQQAISFQ